MLMALLIVLRLYFEDKVINQMQRNDLQAAPKFSYFSLNRLKANCHFPATNVDFSCHPNNKSQSYSALPIFNHDLNYFTPTFILSNEKEALSQNLEAERQKFQDKMRDQEEQVKCQKTDQKDLGFRSSASRYCQICKQRFEDYWKHMSDKTHQRKLTKNSFNAHIEQLCLRVNPRSQVQGKPKQSKLGIKKGQKLTSMEELLRCQSQLIKLGYGTHSTQIAADGCEL